MSCSRNLDGMSTIKTRIILERLFYHDVFSKCSFVNDSLNDNSNYNKRYFNSGCIEQTYLLSQLAYEIWPMSSRH